MVKKIFTVFFITCVICTIFSALVFYVLGPMLIGVFTGCAWWLLGYLFTIPAVLTILVIIGANKYRRR
jgi:hypothetical protein